MTAGRFIEPLNCSFLVRLLNLSMEVTAYYLVDALLINELKAIQSGNNIPLLLNHLRSKDSVGHDYCDCLQPKYNIPGLVSCLPSTCTITPDQISHMIQSLMSSQAD